MPVEITIPSPGESVSEVVVAWRRADGEWVEKDEIVAEIESDKATLEVSAPASGLLKALARDGQHMAPGAVIGTIDPSASAPAARRAAAENGGPAAPPPAEGKRATPLARKVAADKGVELAGVRGTGSAGKITKSDVLAAAAPPPAPPSARPAAPRPAPAQPPAPGSRGTRRERLSPLRRRIAERLVAAQHGAAMLTTFNEADMTAVLAVRREYQDQFTQKHGVGLGFMSFFVKACVSALNAFPRVNAYIAGEEVEHHDFVDVAIAVSTEKGLVVPVVRNAESLGFAQIEARIKDLADRAREGTLTVDELTGGTFTITNGGVFGSLLSTPILNPPQSAILGMHRIVNRPVEDPERPGQIALRPMMYLALTYDHRLVDGEQAVRFLVHVRRAIEDPKRLLLDL
jgi:2-oxoglutarate dehydrogenase E2 component (dihydrolipoamide succinyltransferase)